MKALIRVLFLGTLFYFCSCTHLFTDSNTHYLGTVQKFDIPQHPIKIGKDLIQTADYFIDIITNSGFTIRFKMWYQPDHIKINDDVYVYYADGEYYLIFENESYEIENIFK